MQHREFIYVGDPVPELDEKEYSEFYLHFQKSILAALEKKGLLTHSQYNRCVEETEKRRCKKKRNILLSKKKCPYVDNRI